MSLSSYEDALQALRQRIRDLADQLPPSIPRPDIPSIVDSNSEEPESPASVAMAEEANMSIRELSYSPVPGGLPNSIIYPAPAQGKSGSFELKGALLSKLPTFHGLSMEDANQHLQDFQFICTSMAAEGVDIQIMKLKAFPFSLSDKAKQWLYQLSPGAITSWEDMTKAFLMKYFPASKVIMLRKRISGIEQLEGESFSEYYDRFNSLIALCPQHRMKDEALLSSFYDGLLPIERQMLDAAAGGVFVDKSTAVGKELIANRALNAQQYSGVRQKSREVKEISELGGSSSSGLADKVDALTAMVGKLMMAQEKKNVSECVVTEPADSMVGSPSGTEDVNAVGGYFPNRPRYDPFSPTYNPGTKDHPNFRWANNQNVQNPSAILPKGQPLYLPAPPAPVVQTPPPPHHYDKVIEALAASTQALINGQAQANKQMEEVQKNMSSVLEFLNKIQEKGKLPSTTIPNPK